MIHAFRAKAKALILKSAATRSMVKSARRRLEEAGEAENFTPELKAAHKGFQSLPKGAKVVTRKGEIGHIVRDWDRPTTQKGRPKVVNQYRAAGSKRIQDKNPDSFEPINKRQSWRLRKTAHPKEKVRAASLVARLRRMRGGA